MLKANLLRFCMIVIFLEVSDVKESYQIESRIFKGTNAVQGEFPYQGALFYLKELVCGCSLIHSKWAITAAHCTYNEAAAKFEVYFGEVDRRKMLARKNVNLHCVLQIYNHPAYKDDGTFPNDISLLKLNNAKDNASKLVSSITLVSTEEANNFENDFCTIVGWGLLNKDKTPEILQKAKVPILSNAHCKQLFRKSKIKNAVISLGKVCAGFENGGVDTCTGDSGGPLACMSSSGIPVLLGITSAGEGCAEPNKPGIYTRVSFYLEWINSITHIMERSKKAKPIQKPENFYTDTSFSIACILLVVILGSFLVCVSRRRSCLKIRCNFCQRLSNACLNRCWQ